MIELANALAVSFTECDSAFEYFLQFKTYKLGKTLNEEDFIKGFISLTNNRFVKSELARVWKEITHGHETMGKELFRSHFDGMRYQGSSTLRTQKGGASGDKTKLFSQNSSIPKWQKDIMEKINSLVAASPFTLKDIFRKMDTDLSGKLSAQEFRHGIRDLGLGLTSKEIDQIMVRVDSNHDGTIEYQEFINKFSSTKNRDTTKLIKDRAHYKLAELKELMSRHMSSAVDAFDKFDSDRNGFLTYTDFSNLIVKLHEVAGRDTPTYQVMKDLFDIIDVRKDGKLDKHEWNQTFVEVRNKLITFRFKEERRITLWCPCHKVLHIGKTQRSIMTSPR